VFLKSNQQHQIDVLDRVKYKLGLVCQDQFKLGLVMSALARPDSFCGIPLSVFCVLTELNLKLGKLFFFTQLLHFLQTLDFSKIYFSRPVLTCPSA
jgi:hypothetical protein